MTNHSSDDMTETQFNSVEKQASDAISQATEQVKRLSAQAAEVGEQVYRQAVDVGRYAGRQVEEQPWIAVIATGLIGLGIGVLLGRGSVPKQRSARDYMDGYLPRSLRRN